jgi:putative tributyrin esterase
MAHFEVDFLSYSFGRSVSFTAIIPSAASSDLSDYKRNQYKDIPLLPALYLLHGSMNDNLTWGQYTSIERYAEERQIAVFMISGENRGFVNRGKDHFFDFLEDELPSFCERMFPISTRKEDRYIAGLSMGGFGAYFHGLSQPERYEAIGSFSGPMNTRLSEIGKTTPLMLLREAKKNGTPFPALFLTIGDKDFLYQDNVFFLKFCQDNGIKIHSEIIKGYGHEWRFWDLAVRHFLDWIPRTDAYAGHVRKI